MGHYFHILGVGVPLESPQNQNWVPFLFLLGLLGLEDPGFRGKICFVEGVPGLSEIRGVS